MNIIVQERRTITADCKACGARTLKEIETYIEFVKRDIAECRKNNYSTDNDYEDLLKLYAEKRAIIATNDLSGEKIDGDSNV